MVQGAGRGGESSIRVQRVPADQIQAKQLQAPPEGHIHPRVRDGRGAGESAMPAKVDRQRGVEATFGTENQVPRPGTGLCFRAAGTRCRSRRPVAHGYPRRVRTECRIRRIGAAVQARGLAMAGAVPPRCQRRHIAPRSRAAGFNEASCRSTWICSCRVGADAAWKAKGPAHVNPDCTINPNRTFRRRGPGLVDASGATTLHSGPTWNSRWGLLCTPKAVGLGTDFGTGGPGSQSPRGLPQAPDFPQV